MYHATWHVITAGVLDVNQQHLRHVLESPRLTQQARELAAMEDGTPVRHERHACSSWRASETCLDMAYAAKPRNGMELIDRLSHQSMLRLPCDYLLDNHVNTEYDPNAR